MPVQQNPDDANQYGPFTEAITGPLTPQAQRMPGGGAPTQAGALASFAANFIQGLQAGRRSAFERSERTKMEQERNFDAVFQHIQQDPNTSAEGKKAALQTYIQKKFSTIQDGLKDVNSQPELKDNPMMHVVKGVVTAVAGPKQNPNHKLLDVNSLLNIANDPKYKISPAQEGAAALENVLGKMSSPAAGAGAAAPTSTPVAGTSTPVAAPATPTEDQAVQAATPASPQPQLPVLPWQHTAENAPAAVGAPGTAPAGQPAPSPAVPQQAAAITPPPPGVTRQGSLRPAPPVDSATAAPTNQAEAWANPKFRESVANLQKNGIDWTTSQLGQWYSGLPKTGPIKANGAPYTLKEDGKWNLYRDYVNPSTGLAIHEYLGEGKPPTSSGGRPVNMAEAVTMEDAQKTGATYQDALSPGHTIDIHDPKLAGMQLKGVATQDGIKWILFSPTNQTVRVGGHVYAANSRELQNLAAGNGVDLGQISYGSNSSHEVPVVDANGNTIAVRMGSSTAPVAPGIPGRPNAAPRPGVQRIAPPTVAPQASPQASPQAAPVSSAAPVAPATYTPPPAGAAPRTPPPGVSPLASNPQANPKAVAQTVSSGAVPTTGGRLLPGMQAGERNNQLAVVKPIRAAAMQMFGDPKQPETKGLLDYAPLADNSQAAEKLGTAFKLAMDSIHQSQAHAGGFGEWLKNVSGAQAAIESSRATVLNDSLKDLQSIPGALDAFNSTLAAYSTAIGLRAISKASASKSSADAIERDLPMIGVNTVGSKDFYDKLSHYAQEVNDGTKGLGVQVFDPGEREYLRGGIQQKIAGLRNNAPDPAKSQIITKSGPLKVGGIVKDASGRTHKVTGFTVGGGIITAD